MPQRIQNLTLNDELQSEYSVSFSKIDCGRVQNNRTQRKLKKRRFKEIDNAWDLNMDEGSESVIATQQRRPGEQMSDETLSSISRKGNNRRCIKLNYKKINRICNEMDL